MSMHVQNIREVASYPFTSPHCGARAKRFLRDASAPRKRQIRKVGNCFLEDTKNLYINKQQNKSTVIITGIGPSQYSKNERYAKI